MTITLDQLMRGDHDLTTRSLGVLNVTSGSLALIDPMLDVETPAFSQRVPPGAHEVEYLSTGDTPAFLVVRFGHSAVASWALAVTDDDPPIDRADFVAGTSVDSAKVALVDAEAQDQVAAAGDAIRAMLSGTTYAGLVAGAAVVSVGIDGLYPAWWALDASGAPVALLVPTGHAYVRPQILSDAALAERANVVARLLAHEQLDAIREAGALGRHGEPLVPRLEVIAMSSEDSNAREEAARSLARLVPDLVKTGLVCGDLLALVVARHTELDDSDLAALEKLACTAENGTVALAASEALERTLPYGGGGHAVDMHRLARTLRPRLEGTDANVRLGAAIVCRHVVERFDFVEGRTWLLALAGDPDPRLRTIAANLAGADAAKAGFDLAAIVAFLDDSDASVVLRCTHPFCTRKLTDPETRHVIARALMAIMRDGTRTAAQRDQAGRQLGWLGTAGIDVKRLRRELGDD